MLNLRLAALCLTALLCGCGSSSNTSASQTGGGVVPSQVRLGRAQSTGPLVGARVQVLGRDGRELGASVLTEAGGIFQVAPGAGAFRLVVTPANGPSLAAVIDGLKGGFAGVNYVTNLVSVYLDLHPELTLAQAEERVRSFLLIPAGVDLGTGLGTDYYWFSRSVFAIRAAANGGVEAYTQALARQVDTGPPQPFAAADGDSKSLKETLTEKVVEEVIPSALSAGAKPAFGWVTSLAGFHIGGPTLKQISAQLNQIQTELGVLVNLINQLATQAAYTNIQTQLHNDAVIFICDTSNQLSMLASAYGNVTDSPATGPDQQTTNMVGALGQHQWQALANEILDYLLGRGPNQNMVSLYSQIIMDSLNADSPATYLGYPVRSNGLLGGTFAGADYVVSVNSATGEVQSLWSQKRAQLAYYLKVLSEAMCLTAEFNHISTRANGTGPYGSNAGTMNLAKQLIYSYPFGSQNNILAQSQLAAQQLPYPLTSDQVLIDQENGVTWWLTVMPPVQYFANEFGSPAADGPYGNSSVNMTWYYPPNGNGIAFPPPPNGVNFAYPTQAQLDSLHNRLQAISTFQHTAYPTPTLAMKALGFQGGPTGTTELKVWMYTSDYSNYIYNGGQTLKAYTYDLNTGKTAVHDEAKDHDTYWYLLCLPYPGAAELNPTNPLLANAVPSNISVQIDSQTNPTQLTATATNSVIQSGGAYTIGNTTYSAPVSNVTRPDEDITRDVVWYSSNTDVADVSNLAGSKGRITWHPRVAGGLTNVTFSALYYGYSGPPAALTVSPPTVTPVSSVVRIEVLPTNLLYLSIPVGGIQELFNATGITSDNQAVVLDKLVTWSVVSTVDPTTTIPSTQAGFTTTTPGELVINQGLTIANLTIQATYQNVTGNAPIVVSLPLAP